MNDLVCTLTGHRNLPPAFDRDALLFTLEDLIKEGVSVFWCGMARGFDLVALDCLVELKQWYHVRVKACIPHAGQEKDLPRKERGEYLRLLAWCDEKIVLSETYYPSCFLVRDRYMVDRSDMVLAYLRQEKGGTAYTVGYAREKGLDVRLV